VNGAEKGVVVSVPRGGGQTQGKGELKGGRDRREEKREIWRGNCPCTGGWGSHRKRKVRGDGTA